MAGQWEGLSMSVCQGELLRAIPYLPLGIRVSTPSAQELLYNQHMHAICGRQKNSDPITQLESTLLQVFIPNGLKLLRVINLQKNREKGPILHNFSAM